MSFVGDIDGLFLDRNLEVHKVPMPLRETALISVGAIYTLRQSLMWFAIMDVGFRSSDHFQKHALSTCKVLCLSGCSGLFIDTRQI